MNLDQIASDWITHHELTPPQSERLDWGITISLSSAPLSYWLTRKSKIANEDLWISMDVHRVFGCRVNVFSKDKRVRVNWSPNTSPEVISGSIIHRKRTSWPSFENPNDFPNLVKEISILLGKKILPEAEVTAYTLKTQDLERLAAWLSEIASSVKFRLGNIYGPIPSQAIYDDSRKEGAGLTICFS